MEGQRIETADIRSYVEEILGENEHAKRVASIANGVSGLVQGAMLSVQAIGLALAQADGLSVKHATKQVDRLLSNRKFDVMERCKDWIAYEIGECTEIVVALDWTDYDSDGQATVSLAMDKGYGRASPLMWKTVHKSELKNNRNRMEDELLVRFHEYVPSAVHVTLTADRGFADQKLFSFLERLGFDYVIRIKGCTTIYQSPMQARAASRWLKAQGQVHTMRDVYVTQDFTPVARFVSVKKPAMKEAWYLLSSRSDLTGWQLLKLYQRRFTIEEMFRDEKDPRFGMGLSQTRISQPERRDRMLFLAALARDLLTLLGRAGESLGMDRMLKVNTVKTRTHSLYRQGCYYYGALPAMKQPLFESLILRFAELLAQARIHLWAFALNQKLRG